MKKVDYKSVVNKAIRTELQKSSQWYNLRPVLGCAN